MILAFLKVNKVSFALVALLGSLAGVIISALDLEKALKEKKKS